MITWDEVREARKKIIEKKVIQDDLPGMLEAETKAKQSDIPVIETQKHLAKWGLKFEKYANFSKDPIFRMRMMDQRRKCFNMMTLRDSKRQR